MEQRVTTTWLIFEDQSRNFTVVFASYLLDDIVHAPAIEILVTDDQEGDLVLVPVSLDSLQRVVSVARDAFVDREKDKVESV